MSDRTATVSTAVGAESRASLAAHAPSRPRPWPLTATLAALGPYVVSRFAVWIGTEFGARYIPTVSKGYNAGLVPSAPLVPFFHWDSDYYAAVMRYFYGAAPSGVQPVAYRAAFFPLYPLLARLAGGSDWAMFVIPNVCFLIALALLYELARRRFDAQRAQLVLWLVALGPAAMFFSYPYSESLLLMLAVGAFLLMDSGHPVLAGVVGIGAAASRFPGVLVGAALATDGLVRRRAAIVAAAALPLLGVAAVALVDWRQIGDPLGFVHGQSLWVGASRNPLHILGSFPKAVLEGDPFRPEALGIPVLLVFAAAAVWVALRMPPAYGVYTVLQVALAAVQGWHLQSFYSVPRYMAVIFPCYFAFAALLTQRPGWRIPWLVVSAGAMLTLSALYGSWQFIG